MRGTPLNDEWGKWIAGYLVNVPEFEEGIKVIKWEQEKQVSFVRFISLNTQEEWKMIRAADGYVALTTNEAVQTLKDATSKRNRERKIWQYQSNKYPYEPEEE